MVYRTEAISIDIVGLPSYVLDSAPDPRGARRHQGKLSKRVLAGASASILALLSALPAQAANPSPSATPIGPPVDVSGQPGSTPPPDIEAFSWVVADAASGKILASKGANVQLPMASTLKALTAYTVLPRLDPKSTYTATKKDQNTEGSHVGIVAGGTYTVHELLTGLMLPSGNDAASALANANGGWPKTLAEMNAEAARLGAVSTNAKNPSGLDARGQVSSAADLVTIFRAGLEVDSFREYIGMKTATFPGTPPKPGKKRKSFEIYNQDRLLMTNYPGIIGGKTGYTTKAGRTFVGAATRGDTTLLFSFMRTGLGTEEAGRKLLDWAFANAGLLNPLATLPAPQPVTDAPVRVAAAKAGAKPPAPTPAPSATAPAAPESTSGLVNADSVGSSTPPDTVVLPWLNVALAAFLFLLGATVVTRLTLLLRTHKDR